MVLAALPELDPHFCCVSHKRGELQGSAAGRAKGRGVRAGVCALPAAKHKMARARSRRLVLLEVVLPSRSPELPLLYLTCEASSRWTNRLELTDTGRKVAGDVHGVDPLGIAQALGFCFEQLRSQGSHTLL